MAFYLRKNRVSKKASIKEDLSKPIVGLTARQWDFPDFSNSNQKKRKQARYLEVFEKFGENVFKKWGGSIIIFSQSRGPGRFENDREISQRLMENLKKFVPQTHLKYLDLEETCHPQEIIDILGQIDLLLATRFHSAIFSLMARTPVIAVSYQQKGIGIMKDLNLERYCRDISALETSDILNLGEEILSHAEKIRMKIEDESSNARKKIEAAFSHFESIVCQKIG